MIKHIGFGAWIAAMVLLLTACTSSAPPEKSGFAISLAETGEVILTDKHIASFDWRKQRIHLSQDGIDRWAALGKYDTSFDPPIPQLGRLSRQEFILTVEGREMYRGYFWSFASSLLRDGVLLYDVLGLTDDELWLTFTSLEAKVQDPRWNPAIAEYFQRQEKLVDRQDASSAGLGVTGQEPIVGRPCEGCEEIFRGIPKEIPSAARIAPSEEPGEPLRIEGPVLNSEGKAAPGIIVYAYHTIAAGVYPRPTDTASRHGRLRGWVRSTEGGRYRFETIRPGGYPNSDMPAHIHMHVLEPGRCTYYIDAIVFTDDPRLTPDKMEQYRNGRGGPGVVTPRRAPDGTWMVTRDIHLGDGIPGYGRSTVIPPSGG